jgi:hypothetical protein
MQLRPDGDGASSSAGGRLAVAMAGCTGSDCDGLKIYTRFGLLFVHTLIRLYSAFLIVFAIVVPFSIDSASHYCQYSARKIGLSFLNCVSFFCLSCSRFL